MGGNHTKTTTGGGGSSSSSNMRKVDEISGDVIADILSRLPLKSVLRFKLVSESWYSLISDPLFINFYSKRTSPNPKILFSISLKSSLSDSELKLLDYESPSFKTEGPLSFPKNTPLKPFKIIGSSFGLVCVATDYCKSFYIWNPTTRESRNMPDFCSSPVSHYDYLHGLGYDSVANDFKVVISLYPTEFVPKVSITYNVFSLKANSWKEIKSPFQFYYNPSKFPSAWQFRPPQTKTQFKDSAATTLATVLNGVFHWLVRAPNEKDPQIIAFDSTKETFRKLQIPKEKFSKLQIPPNKSGAVGVLSLLEHKGCLCLFCNSEDSSKDIKEIWMMKEYGDQKSWIHLLSIYSSANRVRPPSIFKALCVTERNEVVYYTVGMFRRHASGDEQQISHISMMRPESNTISGNICISPDSIFGAVLYEESLISPHDIHRKGLSMSALCCLDDLYRAVLNHDFYSFFFE